MESRPMRTGRRRIGVLLGLCLSLAGLLPEAGAEGLARIVAVSADAASQRLELTVEDGAFDPLLSLERLPNQRFRVVIEGDAVRFDPGLRERFDAVRAAILQAFPDVERVSLEDTLPAQPHGASAQIRLLLETRAQRMPQIRDNSGRRVLIGLAAVGPAASATPQKTSEEKLPEKTSDEMTPDEMTLPVTPAGVSLSTGAALEVPASAEAKPASPPDTSSLPAWQAPDFSLAAYFASPASAVPQGLRAAWAPYQDGQHDAAQAALRAYRQENPDDPVARYLQAEWALDASQPAEALALLTTLTEQSPAFCVAWITRIRQTLVLGGSASLAQADALLQQALATWPDHPELVYLSGLRAEIGGDIATAARAFTRTLALSPWHERAAYRRALCDLKGNRLSAAIAALTQALRLNPDDIAAQKALAYAYQISERPQDALRLNRQALKPDALMNYAGLLLQTSRSGPEAPTVQAQAALLYQAAGLLISEGEEMRRYLARACAEAGLSDVAAQAYQAYLHEARQRLDTATLAPEARARLKAAMVEAQAALDALPRATPERTPQPEQPSPISPPQAESPPTLPMPPAPASP